MDEALAGNQELQSDVQSLDSGLVDEGQEPPDELDYLTEDDLPSEIPSLDVALREIGGPERVGQGLAELDAADRAAADPPRSPGRGPRAAAAGGDQEERERRSHHGFPTYHTCSRAAGYHAVESDRVSPSKRSTWPVPS